MRLRNVLVQGLAALVLAGCNDSSPTEPKLVATTPAATPIPTWTGTYDGISPQCASSAQAIVEQTGSAVQGRMTVACLTGQYPFQFSGSFQGNTFTGFAMWGDPEFYPLKGTLSGSSFEITIFEYTSTLSTKLMGQIHLHR